jgi:hypothetical protein
MAKVLVLHYSSYGHIETTAYALAEGTRSARQSMRSRLTETVPEIDGEGCAFQTRPGSAATLAPQPADAAHAIGPSADQLHLPGGQTIDLSDHLQASLIDRALRIGVAVFRDSTFRRTFSRVAFTSNRRVRR